MPAWTPAERRGALLLALLLALGAARDLWRATHPSWTPAPHEAPAPTPAPAPAPAAGAPVRADTLVDLNRADAAGLDALPGIGPVLAGRILERRAALGGFRDPEDLLGVPGIGPRLFERLRPRVCVRPAPPGPARGGAGPAGGGGARPRPSPGGRTFLPRRPAAFSRPPCKRQSGRRLARADSASGPPLRGR